MNFSELNLSESLVESVAAMNFEQLTPVQEQAIPPILEGRDVVACAQTGTGKTAAYLVPVMQHITDDPQPDVQCLILAPTRELVQQIDAQIDGLGYFAAINSTAIYGGKTGGEVWERQRQAIERGADILVATPGRLMAHMQLGYVDLSHLKFLVLDEADKMLDMGFLDDIMEIVKILPTERQTLLFSATMPNKIRQLAQRILRDPTEVNIAISKPAEKIDQKAYLVYDRQKPALIRHLVETLEGLQSVIIFTSRKSSINDIVRMLKKTPFTVKGISSDLEQFEREEIMRDFKNRQVQIIVATDVLSRGIDVDSISHVINYDVPQDAEDYIHRIGRTARAESTGQAITFINEEKQHRILKIEKLMERELPKLQPPADIGKGPEFRVEPRGGGQERRRKPRRDQRGPRNEASRSEASRREGGRPEGNRSEGSRNGEQQRRRKKRRRPPRGGQGGSQNGSGGGNPPQGGGS